MIHRRHSRQARLAEVGEAGQARIAASAFTVARCGLAGEIEARYLAGAGVSTLVVRDARVGESAREVDPDVRVETIADGPEPSDRATLPLSIDDPTAREIARGAHDALVKLRRVLLAHGETS